MTTDDIEILDAIESSYAKRIELGLWIVRVHTWNLFFSLVNSDSEWHFMEAIGMLQCVATTDKHSFNIRSTSLTLLQANSNVRAVERGR